MMKHSERQLIFFVIALNIYQICGANVANGGLNIAIIGAGPSGLVSAKQSIASGHNVTVFEQSEEIGGVWVYTDEVGKNKYGANVHTAMYKGLRANGPYQMLEFPDHFYPNGTIPFPTQPDILKYLYTYTERFNLDSHIKRNHQVIRVLPIENDKWQIIVKDLAHDKFITQVYDAVFVCNGHFFSPRIPKIEGANEFKGRMLHSHDFRTAEAFHGEKVLVIGAGSSGQDIVLHLSNIARSVTLSVRKKENETADEFEQRQRLLPPKTTLKHNVKRFTADGAEFIDGTQEKFTTIIYATGGFFFADSTDNEMFILTCLPIGYNYSYPFLSVDSGIHVDDNYVQPLYKQMFNIKYPTMIFIGLQESLIIYYVYDIQVRCALKHLSGEKTLPPKSEMLKDLDAEFQTHSQSEQYHSKLKVHQLVSKRRKYADELSEIGGIEKLPKVFDGIAYDAINDFREQPLELRKYKYTIIDDKTHKKERYEN